MRRHGFVAAFALVAAFVAGQTYAATMNWWLSEESAAPLSQGVHNPEITLNPGEEVTLTVWVKTNGTKLNGATFNIATTVAGVVNTVDGSINVYNPNVFGTDRWEAGFAPGTSVDNTGYIYQDPVLVAINANGIGTQVTDFADTTRDAGQAAYPLLTLTLRGDAPGVTELFFEIAGGGLSYAVGANAVPTSETFATFGAGDDAIAAVGSLNPAGRSLLADATITVVPEPASLGLLALGALALVRRRR